VPAPIDDPLDSLRSLRAEPFRALFVAHKLPMWLYDRGSLAIVDVNDAALAHFGLGRDAFLRANVAELNETNGHRADGRIFDAVSQPCDLAGRSVVLVTLHESTALRQAETALARAEDEQRRLIAEFEERVRERTVQLQAAIAELEAFSYSVSHDLRAPLRSIAGFSQALIEDAGPSLSADARDDIARIVAASRRMDHLINDLLNLSMVTRADMTRESVDVTELATRIIGELSDTSPTRPVATTVAPGMVAYGDPRLVRVVLENLLTNAWKFTSRRERACIEVGQTDADGASPVFFVRDNGVGFDPAFADKLFGPFQRLHDAAEFPGTGIGLATVRRIVLRHGGRVWAESRPGQGASFYFTLQ
jgi:light-regulated signal transduction histidine kinase (bacteriophytochrome)